MLQCLHSCSSVLQRLKSVATSRLISTVKEVEERLVLVLFEDQERWIEFTPPDQLPAKPPGGHRVLNCTVREIQRERVSCGERKWERVRVCVCTGREREVRVEEYGEGGWV